MIKSIVNDVLTYCILVDGRSIDKQYESNL